MSRLCAFCFSAPDRSTACVPHQFLTFVRAHANLAPPCSSSTRPPTTRRPLPAPGHSRHRTARCSPRCSRRSAPRPPSRRSPRAILRELGATLVLANTYHLYLRPGTELGARFRRRCTLHGLAWPDADRLGRLPGLQPGADAQARRGRRDLPLAHRRQPAPLHAGKRRRQPGGPGRRHHHVPGRVRRAARSEVQRGGAGAHACLGGPLQGGAASSRPGALRHRAGRHLSRSARRERPHPARPGLPRLRHRRAERGRDQGSRCTPRSTSPCRSCRSTSRAI